MARVAFSLVALALVIGVAADKPACKAEKEKAAKLQKETEALQAKLKAIEVEMENIKAQGAGYTKLSILGAAVSAKSAVGSAVQRALESTDLDEKAARHFETMKSFAVDAHGKVAAFDHTEHVNKVKDHALYKQHIVPALKSVSAKAEPLLTQHVYPVMEAHVNPAWNKAKTAAAQAADSALPKLKEHNTKALDALSGLPDVFAKLDAKLHDALEPVFAIIAKAAPSIEKMLPSGGVDRVLLLALTLACFYYSLFLAKFVVTVALQVSMKTTSLVFKLAVVLPLRIVSKVLSLVLCFATGFYCCGLCRRRRASTDSKKDSKKEESKTGKSEAKKVSAATVDELTQLLEASKKKGKIDDAFKLLCKKEKDGKPMEGSNFPENVRGKAVDKGTLKKACGKFKELDIKNMK